MTCIMYSNPFISLSNIWIDVLSILKPLPDIPYVVLFWDLIKLNLDIIDTRDFVHVCILYIHMLNIGANTEDTVSIREKNMSIK